MNILCIRCNINDSDMLIFMCIRCTTHMNITYEYDDTYEYTISKNTAYEYTISKNTTYEYTISKIDVISTIPTC